VSASRGPGRRKRALAKAVPALTPEQADAALAPAPPTADRERATLAAKMARTFIDCGDGKGLAAATSVMLEVMLDRTNVRPRTRALTAARFIDLAQRAAEAGMSKAVAAQVNIATGGPASGTRLEVDLLDAVTRDPEGRRVLYAKLAAGTGVRMALAEALKATEQAAGPERAVDVEVVPEPPKRNGKANGKAQQEGGA
jgi:hypothetical protein